MANLYRIDNRLDADKATCRAVIETPAGSRQKYTYDPDICALTLGSELGEGLALPLAFGFVPQTCAEDGDPIDVMVFFDEPVPAGVVADVRLIGAITCEEEDKGEVFRNDRLLAVSIYSTHFANLSCIDAVPRVMLDQIDAFWRAHNQAKDRQLRILGHLDPAGAVQLVKDAMTPR